MGGGAFSWSHSVRLRLPSLSVRRHPSLALDEINKKKCDEFAVLGEK